MKFYNAFGIKPTNTYTSAGTDYYIPNLKDENQIKLALKAFEKSYKKSTEQINMIYNEFKRQYDYEDEAANLTHLFLATYDKYLESTKTGSTYSAVKYFINNFVVYDKNKKVSGLALKLNDTLFINSGIKVALPTISKNLGIGIGGLYVNKSGKGNAGFDTRAVLVDEDYSGYVHLSMAYTKDLFEIGQNIIYCGDKLTQMILIPVYHEEYEEIDEDEYNKIMKDSLRGSNGFGSSDIKH